MFMKRAVWKNGKKTLTGSWCYNRASDSFSIMLDSIDRTTGKKRCIEVTGDTPEWGNWIKTEKEN